MRKQRRSSVESAGYASAMQSLRRREERFERAANGDGQALMEFMYDARMIDNAGLDDYFNIKKQYEGGDEAD